MRMRFIAACTLFLLIVPIRALTIQALAQEFPTIQMPAISGRASSYGIPKWHRPDP